MSLENMKITSSDKENYGIISASDILDGSASENKEKFDRLPNFIADKHNEVVSFMEDNIYTKTQTNTAIDEKVKEIGSADMTKAVYATNSKTGYVDKSIISDNGIYLNTQLLDVLTGEGENIKFLATDSGTYTTFNRNEIEYAIKQGGETKITLVTGVLYKATFDETNKTINFSSGGLSEEKVKELIEDVYSEEETLTNKVWIDSKPIYRKVFVNTLGNKDIGVVSDNFDKITRTYGRFTTPSGTALNAPYYSSSGVILFSVGTDKQLTIEATTSSWFGSEIEVVVEYTKI